MFKKEVENWFRGLQSEICAALEEEDGKGRFKSDIWERAEGGGGDSRVIEDGNVIEKVE